MTNAQQVTRRSYVEARTIAPDDAGWRFVEQPQATIPRRPSLSWRLRH